MAPRGRGRRRAPGSAFSSSFSLVHGYNDRNELTSTTKGGSNWRAYVYDAIGNRTSATEYGSPNLITYYTANALNQYAHADTNTSPATGQGYRYDDDGNLTELFVAGDMNCDNALDNSDIDAFTLALTDPEDYATEYPACNMLNGDINGDGSLDNGDIDAFTDLLISYSHDGTQVVNAALTWDAENRLIGWEALPPRTAASRKLSFDYDWMGRRIDEKVSAWNTSTHAWDQISDTKYVWDGWLVLEELDASNSNAPIRQYTWGLDLSGLNGDQSRDGDGAGPRQGAGGIGGLLAMYKVSNSTGYAYFCDGNGNVGQVVKPSDGTIAVKYEYDAYGQRTNSAVSGELEQPFSFSTKQCDYTSGLSYYGDRSLFFRFGRWITPDRLWPRAGSATYLFVGNSPIERIDPLGLYDVPSKPPTSATPAGGIRQQLDRCTANCAVRLRALPWWYIDVGFLNRCYDECERQWRTSPFWHCSRDIRKDDLDCLDKCLVGAADLIANHGFLVKGLDPSLEFAYTLQGREVTGAPPSCEKGFPGKRAKCFQ